MKGYGQYCPIALAAEVFAERWTPIILRNLLVGCTHFGEILDGRNASTSDGVQRALGREPRDLTEVVAAAVAAGAWDITGVA